MTSHLNLVAILFSIIHFGISIGPAAADTKALDNAKARMEAARKTYELKWKKWKAAEGINDPEDLYRWSRRWLEAQLDTSDKKTDQVAAYSAHVERMKWLEKFIKGLFEVGAKDAFRADVTATEFYRLEAENWLAQVKAK